MEPPVEPPKIGCRDRVRQLASACFLWLVDEPENGPFACGQPSGQRSATGQPFVISTAPFRGPLSPPLGTPLGRRLKNGPSTARERCSCTARIGRSMPLGWGFAGSGGGARLDRYILIFSPVRCAMVGSGTAVRRPLVRGGSGARADFALYPELRVDAVMSTMLSSTARDSRGQAPAASPQAVGRCPCR